MANKTVAQLEAEVAALAKDLDTLRQENAALVSQVGSANLTIQRLSQAVWVDQGAQELAGYVFDRMPGLKVSTFLGGPVLSAPSKTENGSRASMVMLLQTTDGRTYGIEVYRVGEHGGATP